MAEVRRVFLRGGEIVVVTCAGDGGSPADQLEKVVANGHAALQACGLSHQDIALTRLWMRDRESAATLEPARERLLRGAFRSASSSFFSRERMRERGAVAVEFYAVRTVDPGSRRIADFTPPRRYAHYLSVDDWLFLSGMAEEGANMDIQFDRAFAQVHGALDAEGFAWSDVCGATLFLQRGEAPAEWMIRRFDDAAPVQPPIVTFEEVDELANTPKHLEIEVIAKRRPA